MLTLRVDLAKRLRLSRVEVIFQSDVIFVKDGDTYRVAKHPTQRPETKLPKLFSIESIEVVDGNVVTTLLSENADYYDGKDRIKQRW